MKNIPQIRKSLHKPFWYDRTNGDHIRNFELFGVTNLPISAIIVLGILYSVWFLIGLGVSVVLVVIIFKIYNTKYHRYFRLIERIEKRGDNENLFYIVQSCVSSHKSEKNITKQNVKWKDYESFYSSSDRDKAEEFLDQKTIEKVVNHKVLSPVMKSIRRPGIYDKFREKNNLSRKEITLYTSVAILPVLVTLFTLLLTKLIIASFVFGFILLCLILMYMFYARSEKRFLRVIERTEEQGRYKRTSYGIQSYISKKDLSDVASDDSLKWKDYCSYGYSWGDSLPAVFSHFEKETIENKVVEKVL